MSCNCKGFVILIAAIFLQVFHRLLKAHATEARNVVRQALAILTPAVPTRMDDGNVRLGEFVE